MIIKATENTAICAPAFDDLAATLVKYRTFMGESLLEMSDLISFLTSPSPKRDLFLAELTLTVSSVDGAYLIQKYN